MTERTNMRRSISVYDATIERIKWIYDEFNGNVRVSWSGGKDSTALLIMTRTVADMLGVKDVPTFWLDQEVEWQATRDFTRDIADRPGIDFSWFQVPIQILNSANMVEGQSAESQWLQAWDPTQRARWMRPQEPDAVTVSPYDTDRFSEWLNAHNSAFDNGVTLNGVRIEESHTRRFGMMHYATYKHVTWGAKTDNPTAYRLSPIFDWSWRDVWKLIHDSGWGYNTVYDVMYQHGATPRQMRVSSLIHETAVRHLYELHEIEPATWEAATRRLEGINSTHHVDLDDMFTAPKDLPPMFDDWRQYRDYLIEALIPVDLRQGLTDACDHVDRLVAGSHFDTDATVRSQIKGVLGGYRTSVDNLTISLRKKMKAAGLEPGTKKETV